MTEHGSVLVMDRDESSLRTLSEFLTSNGFSITVADNPEAIVSHVSERGYDAIILDTDDDSPIEEFVQQLKRIHPGVELIVLTEQTVSDQAMAALSRGAYAYLQRPVRLAALLHRLNCAVRNRKFYTQTHALVEAAGQTTTALGKRVENLERLLRFDRELMSILDYRRVIDAILIGMAETTGADTTAVLLIRDRLSAITTLTQTGAKAPLRDALLDRLLANWNRWGGDLLNRNRIIINGDEVEADGPITDAVVAPLVIRDSLIGAIGAFSTSGQSFDDEAATILHVIGGRAEIVIEQTFRHEHTKILATTDSLTGLLNRRVFRENLLREYERSHRLHVAGRSDGQLSVIMCDIDHFKPFNDTYGHQLGDEILKMVAGILVNEARRAPDIVARYGGEEFIIIAPETSLASGAALAERIRSRIERTPYRSSHGDLHVTMSFGVSSYPECDAQTPEELVAQADTALYDAKNSGRNRVSTAPQTVAKATVSVSP